MPRQPKPPEPRRLLLPEAVDRRWLAPLHGTAWTTLGLPSGGIIAAVEGHLWKVEVQRAEGGEDRVSLVLEARKSAKPVDSSAATA